MNNNRFSLTVCLQRYGFFKTVLVEHDLSSRCCIFLINVILQGKTWTALVVITRMRLDEVASLGLPVYSEPHSKKRLITDAIFTATAFLQMHQGVITSLISLHRSQVVACYNNVRATAPHSREIMMFPMILVDHIAISPCRTIISLVRD